MGCKNGIQIVTMRIRGFVRSASVFLDAGRFPSMGIAVVQTAAAWWSRWPFGSSEVAPASALTTGFGRVAWWNGYRVAAKQVTPLWGMAT